MTPTPNNPYADPWNSPACPEDDVPEAALPHAAWEDAFEAIGGADTLAGWALAFPSQFFALRARQIGKPAAPQPMLADVSDEPMTEEEWMRQTEVYREAR
jgi:hypothetical protein